MKSFGSDNHAGIDPLILESLIKANSGSAVAYGNDPWSEQAVEKFKEHFGEGCQVLFVLNGTGANTIALKTFTDSFNAIVCSDVAHINTSECGAPQKFSGCPTIPIQSLDGKLTFDQINEVIDNQIDQHHNKPNIVSLSQTTELGTVYDLKTIKQISDMLHKKGCFLHIDGARFANAAVFLGCSLKELTSDVGVDILSFGGTKNGLLFGEALVFFDESLVDKAKYFRKQATQLFSKMRFIACQFESYLTDDLWKKNAVRANNMAKFLMEKLLPLQEVKITRKAESNSIFVKIPDEAIEPLQKRYFFHIWDEKTKELRWMTSFDTTRDDICNFVDTIKEIITRI